MSSLASLVQSQTQPEYKIRVESNQVQAPMRAQSNLVLVPAFVIDKKAMSRVTDAEWECADAENTTFRALLPSQPYTQEDCSHADAHGLAAPDFHVFQAGVEQKVEQVAVERYHVAARDNMTWHAETSLTPTGIWSSSDLLGLLQPDLVRWFYRLAYVPRDSVPGCHRIEVRVDRPGTVLFARDQYCTGQSMSDLLYATPYGKQLENDLASPKREKIRLSLQAGYFYTLSGQARVEVSLEFPWNKLFHTWNLDTKTLFARIGVLGTAYGKDGRLAARFGDLMYPPYWPTFVQVNGASPALLAAEDDRGPYGLEPNLADQLQSALSRKDPAWLPARYETQMDLAPGDYDLRVVLGDTQNSGTAEVPLHIESYDGKGLGISSVMLCKRFRDAHVAAVERAAASFAPQYIPLVSKAIEVTPAGDTGFKRGQVLMPYVEIYEPLLATAPATGVQAHFRVFEAKTAQMRDDFTVDGHPFEGPGALVIPVTWEILTDKVPKGAYRLEVQATDSAGGSTPWRTADFTIE
jgi:hypothetical protein